MNNLKIYNKDRSGINERRDQRLASTHNNKYENQEQKHLEHPKYHKVHKLNNTLNKYKTAQKTPIKTHQQHIITHTQQQTQIQAKDMTKQR